MDSSSEFRGSELDDISPSPQTQPGRRDRNGDCGSSSKDRVDRDSTRISARVRTSMNPRYPVFIFVAIGC